MNTRDDERTLEDGLAALPRRITPKRDLWPKIASHLDDGPSVRIVRPRWALGMAAGILLGVLAFMTIPRGYGHLSGSIPSSRDASLVRARVVLLEEYRERLSQLDAPTRARVERDLAMIRDAEKDLADALQNSPNSEVLLRLYAGALHQEFDLYDTVLTTTEINSVRNST